VYLDSVQNEACAKIKFRTDVGNFTYSPYWIDSVAHLSGFVLNGSDTTPSDCVFISHGWGSMKFLGSLSIDKQYESYVRMQPTKTKGVMSGDVYLFQGDQVVGLVEDLKFQQVKRTILDQLLPNTISLPSKPALMRPSTDYSPCEVPTPRAVPRTTAVPATIPAHRKSEFSNVLRAIADEIGVDVLELEEDAEFANLGVDSLLTISILTRLGRQLINEELPSTLFIDHPSVRELRLWYLSRGEKKEATVAKVPSYQHSSDADSLHGYDPFSGDDCPDTPISDYGEMDSVPSRIDTAEMVKKIIAHEVGISPQEIEPQALLSELGIDSLLSLSILARIRDQMGMGLSSTFFAEHPTFEDVQSALRGVH
jgi:acyl carrier protein